MSCEERIRLLGQELEQRQGALDKATEHLTQASRAPAGVGRDGAAAGGGHAADRHHRCSKAEQQAGGLDRLAGELETRADALKTVERQLTHFEGLLGQWESAQAEAAEALEQTLARQGAVEALEAQVKHVFDLAERAVEHAQTIGSARAAEIEETRAAAAGDPGPAQVGRGVALHGFEARERQLERAEQRLARAEALALEVRSTVESLQAQRAVVEHVMERSGALTFQMKQAEALVERCGGSARWRAT